jgi:hypothetical protein
MLIEIKEVALRDQRTHPATPFVREHQNYWNREQVFRARSGCYAGPVS